MTLLNKSRIFILSFIMLMLIAIPAFSSGDNGSVPAVMHTEQTDLLLNGKGIRNKCWIDLFVGALYLKEKNHNAAAIISADEEMSIKIEVISNVITSKRLRDAIRSEFSRVAGESLRAYKQRIDGLVQAFSEDIKIGDTFDLLYTPAYGLRIYKNQQLKTQVAGLDFKKVLFSIWLGEDPQDNSLKNGMLGV